MLIKGEGLRLRRVLAFDEIQWSKILDLLVTKYRQPFDEAEAAVRKFRLHLLRPFNLYLYFTRRLPDHYSRVVKALLECHAADVVAVKVVRSFRVGFFKLEYVHEIECEGVSKSGPQSQHSMPRAKVLIFGLPLEIETAWGAMLMQVLSFLIGVAFYVILAGAILYAVSVFLLFLEYPDGVTVVATRKPQIGLALLCLLMVMAAVSGRAISNLARLSWRKLVNRAPLEN